MKTNPKARQRRATLKDIAEKAGVTQATVSLALNNKGRLPASRTRQIQRIAEELNYRPSVFGRALRSGRTSTIGVVVNSFANSYFHGIFTGFEEILESRNYDFWASQAHDELEREKKLALRMADQGVEGLIIHPCSDNTDHLHAVSEEFGIPVILLSHAHPGFTAVVADDYEGSVTGVEHLLSLRRPKVLHIAGAQDRTGLRNRCRAFIDVMNRQGLDFVEQDDICYVNKLTPDRGYDGMAVLLARHKPPFAVFAANDVTAFGALRYCRKHGLKVPKDVAMLTFGGNALIDELDLEISAMQIPFVAFGRTVALSVLESISDPMQSKTPRVITLATTLIVRQSTMI